MMLIEFAKAHIADGFFFSLGVFIFLIGFGVVLVVSFILLRLYSEWEFRRDKRGQE